MWMLVPVAFAGKLLSAFRKPLRSLWSSLVPWVLWLRATLWLPGGQSARPPQPGRGEAQGSRGDGGQGPEQPITPTSVNYHFTRQCNYKCGFCFHTAKTSFVLPLDEAKRGLRLLQEAGESPIPGGSQGAATGLGMRTGGRGPAERPSREGELGPPGEQRSLHLPGSQCPRSPPFAKKQMRFLNCRNGRKDPSKSILDVGVEEAIKFSGFDEKMFLKRGGKYVWSKADLKLDW
uniref:S-adenosylmethionine-dependent nucleotide dehydratase RSAD2 n=1 Tax=Panthera onca TaxID=9690 RepID=UPI002954E48F|nr:S-adenosylmethionine-dependent nucleotide dehydratase RSAD2 [Panthera onca]